MTARQVARIMAVAALSIVWSAPGRASAQSDGDKIAAEQYFIEGRKLMERGDYKAACPKLAASHKLDPSLGAVMNLARCYEEQGKLASAWVHYRQAANFAAKSRDRKGEAFASKQADALEPRLPRLQVDVSAAREISGLTVTRGDATLELSVLDTPLYVDPGTHKLEATAPGHKSFSLHVSVAEGETKSVEIPRLEPEQAADEPVEPSGGIDVADPAPTGDPGRTRKLIGLASGGVGIVTLGVGLIAGQSARSRWNEAFDSGLCDADTLQCSDFGQDLTDDARARARTSNILVGAGVVLTATGALLYLTAPERARAARAARIMPVFGPDERVGVAVTGRF